MPQKAANTAEIILKKAAKPRGNGILRFKVVEILLTYTGHLTMKQLREKMADAGCPVNRNTLAGIMNEIRLVPLPGHLLTSKQTRAGKTKCLEYKLITTLKKK